MKRLMPKVAIFILGIIVGASSTSVFLGETVDALYMENRLLKQQLATVEDDLKQLEEKKQTPKRVVTKISTRVNFAAECDLTDYEKSTAELKVDQNVREWLKLILGQDLDTVNYQLVPRIIDNREIEVDGKKIGLQVELVVISENLMVFIEVLPVKEQL
ncbi:MAG: hypothetical protein VR67_15560 [Peptococcaceae bacterium BRH_c8a]|nr:MAG: hypothetical protein VR67_15560 [Peptococcaceae bacterium BRH_c8a]